MLWVCFILNLITFVNCGLNLYLSTEEMKKLLGLEKELFYVRDGTINKYAMGFLIPVPSYVSSLQFTWDSSPPTPNNLFYTITTSSSSTAALPSPSINISTSGIVPENPQTWTVTLMCSGLEAGEVVVSVNIAITGLDTSFPLNVTNLKFKRKKTCHMYTIEEETVVETDDSIPTYIVFFAGVGGCLFVLVLVLSLVIGSWLRSTKQKPDSINEISKNTEYTALPPPPDNLQIQNNSGLSQLSNNGMSVVQDKRPSYMTSTLLPPGHQRPVTDGAGAAVMSLSDADWSREDPAVSPPLDKLVVDRLDLTLGDLLMEGTFGRVYQSRLTLPVVGPIDVMVKTIVPCGHEGQAEKLINDGSLLSSSPHKHVLPLLATTSDGTSPMMIYEYLHPGNMKKWLSGCHQPVSTHQCVTIGLQLLSALKHIHKRNIVHGDVAARNCYLTPSLSVKLSDPALSKDLFPNDYHCLGDNENRPVKWMSVERISRSVVATVSSDIWSWGVTIWEILTRAQQPFPDVDPFEMERYLMTSLSVLCNTFIFRYLMDGFRLHQPVNCPDQLYTVIVSCWAHSPHHRASVSTLYTHLQEFNTQLQQFV